MNESIKGKFIARFNEIAACSSCEQQVKRLLSANCQPTNKQWARQAEERRSLWQDLADVAHRQAVFPAEAPAPKARKGRKAPIAAAGQPAEAASAA